jgi:hypothetical protein
LKYRDNMTPEELAQFDKEWQALDAAYAAAAAHDAAQPRPEDDKDYEDPGDYVGMGWVDSRGRP